MPKRTVLATQAADGHLQLLEPVRLPKAKKFPVTLDLPEEPVTARTHGGIDLPTWPGHVIGHLSREEIYGDLG